MTDKANPTYLERLACYWTLPRTHRPDLLEDSTVGSLRASAKEIRRLRATLKKLRAERESNDEV